MLLGHIVKLVPANQVIFLQSISFVCLFIFSKVQYALLDFKLLGAIHLLEGAKLCLKMGDLHGTICGIDSSNRN